MFIKVSPHFYVNTDNITLVNLHPTTWQGSNRLVEPALIYLVGSNNAIALEADAVRFMLEMVEANDALILPGETPREPPEVTDAELAKVATPKASLRTKIAQMLRDTWKGVTLEQITAILHDVHDRSITQDAIDFTITELENEGVAIRIPVYNVVDGDLIIDKWLIYHTGSAEAQTYMRSLREDITANPDPAFASEVPLSDADQTEHNEN